MAWGLEWLGPRVVYFLSTPPPALSRPHLTAGEAGKCSLCAQEEEAEKSGSGQWCLL